MKERYHGPAGAWEHEQQDHWYAKGGVLPVHSFDSGGLLPEGLSIAHNGTGRPEPVGHNLLQGGDLTVNVVLDPNGRQVLGSVVVKDINRRLARR